LVPEGLREFFTASTGASATLLELLSIAIAVEPKSIVGEQSPVESRSRASSAYTALINIFFISVLGTIQTSGLGFLPLILATVGLANTLGIGVNLWRASLRRRSALSSGVGLWLGSTVVYARELWTRSTRRIGRATTRSSIGLFTYLPRVGILGSRGIVYSLPVYRARDITDNRTPDGTPLHCEPRPAFFSSQPRASGMVSASPKLGIFAVALLLLGNR
jgi:hypothetical protein